MMVFTLGDHLWVFHLSWLGMDVNMVVRHSVSGSGSKVQIVKSSGAISALVLRHAGGLLRASCRMFWE